jgi:hypothetical protein
MLAVALFALLPASALAGPDRSARPAVHAAPPTQIATLGGDFPTTLSEEDLVAANADSDNNMLAGYPQSFNSSERQREQSHEPVAGESQDPLAMLPNGQPKYVRIYWFIGGH